MDFTDETIPMPRIGDQAPVFDAVTTQGKIHFPLDFNGKWIILFSHPSDFTPVCTSEFVTFGAMTEEFKALNCQLIGLSVDGLYSHIAWLRTIREKIEYKGKKNVEVQFPLIADVTMEVAHLYGMIQPRESSTNAVRAVFYIDPQGIIRAIIYYPLALVRIQSADDPSDERSKQKEGRKNQGITGLYLQIQCQRFQIQTGYFQKTCSGKNPAG